MDHSLCPVFERILSFSCNIGVYSEIRLNSGIWDRASISSSQYLNSFTVYKNWTSVGAYIIISFFWLITEQRSPGKLQLSRCRFKMADGTMSGGLEILKSAAKRSDQLRRPSSAPLRQLTPVEKVSGGHKKITLPQKTQHFYLKGAQCKNPGRSIHCCKWLWQLNCERERKRKSYISLGTFQTHTLLIFHSLICLL